MGDYNYKLDVFEGPLDLLLHLIEKHKIEITDIPIVEITSQYLEYLDNWNHFDIHYSSEFLVMASTLLQIKSRMLLPKVEPEPDESEDPRDELVAKLELSKLYDIFYSVLHKTVESEDEQQVRQVTVEKDAYRLEDMIVSLASRARRGERLAFRELLVAIESKSGMVTIFMAVLELLKQQELVMFYENDDIIFTAPIIGERDVQVEEE